MRRVFLFFVVRFSADSFLPIAAATDGADVLRAADVAVRKIQSVRYEAKSRTTGAAAHQTPALTAKIRATRAVGDARPRFRMEVDGGHYRQILTSDGHQLLVVDPVHRRYARFDAAEAERSDAFSLLFMAELLHPEPFTHELEQAKSVLVDSRKVDDIPCDVVVVRYDPRLSAEWCIGTRDFLPHSVERIFNPGREGESRFALELSHLETRDAPDGDDAVYDVAPPPGYRPALPIGWRAPQWELKSPAGAVTRLADLGGRVVVMDFWAVWCGPCKRAMPGLQRLHEAHVTQPVSVFGISTWPKDTDPVAYMRDQNYTYGLLLDGDRVAVDYLVKGIPVIYVLSPVGRVLEVAIGPGHEAEIGAAVARGLAMLPSPSTAPAKP